MNDQSTYAQSATPQLTECERASRRRNKYPPRSGSGRPSAPSLRSLSIPVLHHLKCILYVSIGLRPHRHPQPPLSTEDLK